MREPAHLTRRALAVLPIAALAGAAPAVAAAALAPAKGVGNADALLLDLGRRWQAAVEAQVAHGRAWNITMNGAESAEHEAIGDDLHEAVRELFLTIMPIRATTPAGLAVKARILACENDVDEFGDEASIAAAMQARPYFEDKAAFSLILDILRLARAAS